MSVTLTKSFIKNKDGSICVSGLEPTHFPSQQQTLINPPYPTIFQPQTLKQNSYPPAKNICQQEKSLNIPNPAINSFPSSMQQQDFANHCPTKNTYSTSFKQEVLVNACPTKSIFPATLQQQELDNPKPKKSLSLHKQTLITKNTFPSTSLDLMKPHHVRSTSLQQQALINPHPYLTQLKTFPNQDQFNTFPNQDQLKTSASQDQLKTSPVLDHIKTTPTLQPKTSPTKPKLMTLSQDQVNTTLTQDTIQTPTTKDNLNYIATQDQLSIFHPSSEKEFPFLKLPQVPIMRCSSAASTPTNSLMLQSRASSGRIGR